MYIKEGDIVFLVSDGISDNFDPCVSGMVKIKNRRFVYLHYCYIEYRIYNPKHFQ